MNNSYDISFSDYEDMSSKHKTPRKGDISFSDQLADFERLRIAVTKAAAISPFVHEVTIGPNSPLKKDEYREPLPVIEKEEPEENLVEDKLRQELRHLAITKQYDNLIQEKSEETFETLLGNILHKRSEAMNKFFKMQRENCVKNASEVRARTLRMAQTLQENDNLVLLEKARIDEQNCPVVNTSTIDDMNRILEEQRSATARLEITGSHTKIWNSFNEISDLMLNEPLAKPLCEKYRTTINDVLANIYAITEKKGSVNDKDVKKAEILAINLDNIKTNILDELEVLKKEEAIKKIKEEELAKKKELEEKKAQEIKEAQAAAAEKSKAEQSKRTKPAFYSARNYTYFEELRNYLEQYEDQYKDLLQDVNQKKFRFDCQKAVNTPVNALSSVSALHMRDKYDKLSRLLKGERVQVLDIYVTATQHPQGLPYVTALLAKKIVRQGDLLVSSSTEAAYPLAAVTVALWAQFPHFGKLVEAYFHRLCPYLVPMYLPQKEGQTDKEFYLSRGYTYNDEGVVEKQDKFLKRMSGIFRLRCAIWTAKMPKFLNTPHPQGLKYGWQWLASFLNLKPEPDISATLLHDFYIMCGSTCNKSYGKQFRKILELTINQYLKILENIDEGGPKTRLEVYLQTVLKSNDIPQPPNPPQQINW